MTVSNVINQHPYVKDSTREKVVKAMTDLDYRVNVAARNLRTGRTFTIGLAVAELDRPYYGQLAARIVAEAAKHDLRVLIEQTGASRENELDALGLSRNRMYDGLILTAVGLGASDAEMLRVDFPVVILGERIFDGPVDHVAMANVDGAKAATLHLAAQGCQRIAIIDDHRTNETDASSLRFAGYRAALAEANLPFYPDLAVNLAVPSFSLKDGREAGKRLVESGVAFDGIFCVTDTVALGVLRALADADVKVPEQVKVIGFDNIEESQYSIPSLSTVDPDHDAMAKAAVNLLVERIAAGKNSVGPREFTSTFRVVERESTAIE
jgi:DNA-binding LacI/PurR family transcriptional regulator